MSIRTRILALVIGCLCLGGCGFDRVATGPERDDSIHLDGGGADRANVELDMGAGQLTVGGGASKLVDGTFTYNVDAWKPLVTNSTNGTHATVTIKQPSGTGGGGHTKYEWNLNLNDKVLTDLTVHCGAGQADLTLGTLQLRSLTVHMGAGQVKVDLRGTPTHDYDVTINGGVGQADIHLPKDVGVWASAKGGIGGVNVSGAGLVKQGDHWENDAYNKAKVNVKLEVRGGIGEINISD